VSAIGDWLFYEFGASGSGSHYGLLSGAVSDVSELAIFGAVYAGLRRVNCPVTGCWRLGLHRTATGHRVCRKHHPDDELTVEHLHAAHYAALRSATVANYFAARHAAQPAAGDNGYAAGHDAEQAMGSILTAPPGAGDAVYGASGDRHDRAPRVHRVGATGGRHARNAARSGAGADEDRTGAGGSTDPEAHARDEGGQQDGPA
jgi:hypothetical protein